MAERLLFDLGTAPDPRLRATVEDYRGTVSKQSTGKSTADAYRGLILRILPESFLNCPLESVPEIRQRLAHLKPISRYQHLSVLAKFAAYLARRELVPWPVVEALHPGRKPEPKDPRVLTAGEMHTFLHGLQSAWRRVWWTLLRRTAFVCVHLHCGLRSGETLGLLPGDIDTGAGFLHVRRQLRSEHLKTRHGRRALPLTPHLCGLLGELVKVSEPGAPLFIEPGYRSNWIMRRASTVSGVHASANDFRHTFATALIQGGLPLFAVRHWMGHASIETTATHYVNVTTRAEIPGFELDVFRDDAERRLNLTVR